MKKFDGIKRRVKHKGKIKYVYVDEKYSYLFDNFVWCLDIDDKYSKCRIVTKHQNKNIRLHRLILQKELGEKFDNKLFVDHINRNPIDNRVKNLRKCTPLQSSWNRGGLKNTSSKYKGVAWYKKGKNWRTMIETKKKIYFLGYFENEKKAAKAYDKKSFELFGDYAYFNFPSSRAKFLKEKLQSLEGE